MRDKPTDADDLAWEGFETWADDNAIGFELNEWLLYWKCWDAAHLEGFAQGY